jgi:hypothetical protein
MKKGFYGYNVEYIDMLKRANKNKKGDAIEWKRKYGELTLS